MSKIKVQNFGPVKLGFNSEDGFMDIQKCTVFIGNQGSGKSSVAKLISTMSWLEKALYRGDVKENYVTSYNRFVKDYCDYQNLKNYFYDDTIIEYIGKAYAISYREGKLSVSKQGTNNENGYKVPKIMYVPSERNFLSAVENPEKLKGIPKTLSTFWEEMERSLRELTESLSLPVGNVKFEVDKLSRSPKIDIGEGRKLRLSEASSGFQSFVPLFLVSRYLANSINKERDGSRSELSIEEQKRLKTEIERIISNENLSEDVKQNALELLSSKYRNETFLNIVEEIEQNLYPKSQKNILFKLIEYANINPGNSLILTTHSPYVINYLTVAIKAESVLEKIKKGGARKSLLDRLEAIVPSNSCVKASDAVIYELSETGEISLLSNFEGIPSDNNLLNHLLADINQLFDSLLEIEEDLV